MDRPEEVDVVVPVECEVVKLSWLNPIVSKVCTVSFVDSCKT